MLQVVNFLVKHHVYIIRYNSYFSYRNQRQKTTIIAKKPLNLVLGVLCTCWVSCVTQENDLSSLFFCDRCTFSLPKPPLYKTTTHTQLPKDFFLGLAASLLLRRSHFITLTKGLRKGSIKAGTVWGYHLLYCQNPGILTNLLSNPLLPTIMLLLTISYALPYLRCTPRFYLYSLPLLVISHRTGSLFFTVA